MMKPDRKTHQYHVQLAWTGNTGQGTSNYRAYERSHEITADLKPPILGSSDVAFRGDKTKYNPEELLVASLSACHMLWYLHFCAEASIVVVDYLDRPIGTLLETRDGNGHFQEVVLKPTVTITQSSDRVKAMELHDRAHHFCFIANSVNFPVRCEPSIQIEGAV
jgi:organic hydroperoxide reductase OsmC/OhrA